MTLLKKYLLEAVDTMERDHIRLHFFGDMTPIDPELQALAHETDEITEHPVSYTHLDVYKRQGWKRRLSRPALPS